MEVAVEMETKILKDNHVNRENLTRGDKSWLFNNAQRRGMFRVLKSWIDSYEIWHTVVGSDDINTHPQKEHSIRRTNKKTLIALRDLEVEEFMALVIAVSGQKKPNPNQVDTKNHFSLNT